MAAAPVRESWAIAVHEALAGMRAVLLAQLVPGEAHYELVLTTRPSPPRHELFEELLSRLTALLGREDSPLVDDGAGALRFYPARDDDERALFGRLDWTRAVVLHELVD